ncbi:excitatory amino acid transporter 1-like isoform X2 [Actinia tenebrosa]|nr:excitatory amino acid transporter 1-like isoform X2 [Actinia tenebrosa]XP_031568087.1 excitatory amino acid transporter 1-like isoform X2 [Actinia tenebrosa]
MSRNEGKNGCHSCCPKLCRRLRSELLLFLILIGVVFGFIVGIFINKPVGDIKDPERKASTLMLIGFAGELFMNMLKMLILPLIIASLVCSLAALDAKATSRIGRRALLYFIATTILAVILGIALVVSMRPGEGGKTEEAGKKIEEYRTLDAFLDLLRSCFPSNIVAAMFSQQRTRYTKVDPVLQSRNQTIDINNLTKPDLSRLNVFSNGTHNLSTTSTTVTPGSKTVPSGQMVDPKGNMNVLGIVIFSVVFGIVLGRIEDRGLPLKAVFESLNEVIIRMVSVVMWYSPIGICSLIIAEVAAMTNIMRSLSLVGIYMLTVISGLLIHSLVVLPIIFVIVTRRNPFGFIMGMRSAIITAFGTSSSSATLPTTMKCAEKNNKVDARISRFILPLGATVNMDGTALYEAVAAVFIAQANGIDLGIGALITTCVTATAASIGAAGIPQAGLVTLVMVLQAVNLPTSDIALILGVDWFLDRIRTTVNVLGDAMGTGIVEHLSRDDLMNMDFIAREEVEPVDEDRFNPRDTEAMIGMKGKRRNASETSIKETNF